MEDFLPLLLIPAILAFIGLIIYLSWQAQKKRREAMRRLAASLGYRYLEKAPPDMLSALSGLALFKRGHSRRIYNLLQGESGDAALSIMDYRYTTGGGKNSHTYDYTVFLLYSESMQLPRFTLGPESVFHKIGGLFGYQDIDFDSHPDFSKRYLLRGDDESRIRTIFRPHVLEYFERKPGMRVESDGRRLVICTGRRRMKPAEIQPFLEDVKFIYENLRYD